MGGIGTPEGPSVLAEEEGSPSWSGKELRLLSKPLWPAPGGRGFGLRGRKAPLLCNRSKKYSREATAKVELGEPSP